MSDSKQITELRDALQAQVKRNLATVSKQKAKAVTVKVAA